MDSDDAAIAVREHQFRIRHLPGARLASQLPNCLDNMEHASGEAVMCLVTIDKAPAA